MNTYNIEITEPAERDLYEIMAYVSKELLEPNTAKKIISKIAEAIGSLEEFPLRNGLVADERLSHKGIRKIMVDNYIIFYIVTEERKTVTVVRILYSKRNWMGLL